MVIIKSSCFKMAGTNNQTPLNKITFCSYNVKRYDKIKYNAIKSIYKENTFLLIQETWLAEDEFIRQFKIDFPNSECISANKMEQDHFRAGRPYGGVGLCHHSNIKCKIENLNTTSRSICAQILNIENISILLINVYMPCTDNKASLKEYTKILQEISGICMKSPTQHIILGGDWNADLSRNDGRTKLFKNFITQEKLINPLELDIANVPYTFACQKPDGSYSTSTIDHFLMTPNLKNTVTCYEAHTMYNNCSDHVPLVLSLDINIEFHKTYKREFKSSVAWHKCNENSIRDFKRNVDQNIPDKDIYKEVEICKNHKCTCALHTEAIKDLHNQIINICCNASQSCLPYTSQGKRNNIIPGWNEYVKEHADRAKMWHEIWVGMGKPKDPHYLSKIRRKTRLQYHYAIRHVVKENARLRNNKMAEAISENEDRKLWEEVRKITRSNNELPKTMDDCDTTEDISNIFAGKYDMLYNTVSYKNQDMSKLTADINACIETKYPNKANVSDSAHIITPTEVWEAIDKLKHGKKEENGLFSNHFKIATDKLVSMITLLFNCMLTHGTAPDELLLGTMIPLIKDSRGKKDCSDNYRALTIGTGLAKILDLVILNKQAEKLKASDMQFGFKSKSSTTMCTFVAMETIEYYKNNGSNVHALLLDASKAFDRVDYIKLFEKLLKRGMCPLTVRLLLNMYTNQKLQVKWNDCKSAKFNVTNGVRQGGVLSPLLFSVYIDELLEKLKASGIGCYIGYQYVGALGYADDIILLCPSVAGLKKMIKICEDYATDHSIKFNGKKSKYLIFGEYNYNPTLKVNNEIVSRCESAFHLGHLIHTKNTNAELIGQAMKDFNISYYSFIAKFGTCNATTKNKLFHQYCSSMYSSQLWDMESQEARNMHKKWRKAHRLVLDLHYKTHNDLLPLIVNNISIECILDCKYISFCKAISTSENQIVNYIAKTRKYISTSTLGRNMILIRHKYGLDLENILIMSKNKIKDLVTSRWKADINPDYSLYAQIISEMIAMKEERCTRTFLNDDCKFIMDFVGTINQETTP